MMQVTLRKASDLARAAKSAAGRITIDTEITVSVHQANPVQFVNEREGQARQRLADWRDLVNAQYALRDLIGQANAAHGVTSALARKNALDDEEKRLTALAGEDATAKRRRELLGSYGDSVPSGRGHEDDLHTLPAAIEAARKRLETVTTGEARQRLTLPTFSDKTLEEYRQRIQQIGQQRAELLETIARTNVMRNLAIEGETLETLRRHRLV